MPSFQSRLASLAVLLLVGAGAVAAQQPPSTPAAPEARWREVAPENLLVLRLPTGSVLVELAPQFAPAHVAQVRRLAREGFYGDRAAFYRVIDNFVAQAGVPEDVDSTDAPTLPAEFERPLGDLAFVPNDSPDLYAPQTGHIAGFAVGFDPQAQTVWPLHCYGAVAMARGADPHSGSSHFYIVIGRDQRYLDRNLTVFGRVVAGMPHVQHVARADADVPSGVIENPALRTPILGFALAADLPAENRPRVEVMDSQSPAFAQAKARKFYRDSDFFARKPAAVEACAVPGPVRVTWPGQ